MEKTFGVIGGDRRYAELARLLEADGYAVRTYGLEGAASQPEEDLTRALEADVVVLPMPLCGEDARCAGRPLEELFRRLGHGQLVLAGQVGEEQRRQAGLYGVRLTDYLLRESLTVSNAAITAEGAIQTALARLEGTLLGERCLVVGFGRIGKLLCLRLRGLGAKVTATARKAGDLAWIRACGLPALETGALDGALEPFGAVFNTVPAPVLGEALLRQLPKGSLLVDLASRPGIDFAAAEALGLDAVWARGLPGRLAPRAAAAVLRDTVYEIVREEI